MTWLLERGTPVHVGARSDAAAARAVPAEIQGIEQTLFGSEAEARGEWAARARDLSTYHWVDRQRRIVKIPVEEAMEMLVERGHVE